MNQPDSTQSRKGAEAAKVIIRRCGTAGQDPQIFRAYVNRGGLLKPLGVSCSTTGNFIFAVKRCAAKAFLKLEQAAGAPDEIETRVLVLGVGNRTWWCFLEKAGAART